MTTIYLIRHGQASAGSDNYDVLSPIGRQQAKILGEYFRAIDIHFDAAYSGTLTRQKDTATIALGIEDSALQKTEHFNEYHHHEIFSHYLPILATSNEELASAAEAGPNNFMTLTVFTALMDAWANDASNPGAPESIESYLQFQHRIKTGLDQIAASHGPKDTVAVFTSGGVICTIMQSIFKTSPLHSFEMNWGINNAGISRIKQSPQKLHLCEYNNVSHLALLQDDTLITQI